MQHRRAISVLLLRKMSAVLRKIDRFGVEQRRAGQLLTGEIKPLDTALDDGSDFRGKTVRTLRHAAGTWNQVGRSWIDPVTPQQFVELALAQPQPCTRV